jgi:hypothetical protein
MKKVESSQHPSPRTATDTLVLPSRPDLSVSHADTCDALLGFCERVTGLTKALLSDRTDQGLNVSLYTEILQDMRSDSAPSSRVPEELARDLATLVTTQLSSQVVPEHSQYWLAVTSALAAATRTVMPALSEELSESQSTILQHQAESTGPYQERYS